MKEQGKSLGRNPKEVKISHLSNKEFKEMVIRMLIKLERNLGRISTKKTCNKKPRRHERKKLNFFFFK